MSGSLVPICRPRCGAVVERLLAIRGVVQTLSDLPTSATQLSLGSTWLVLQPVPRHVWLWDGTTWLDVGPYQ